MARISIIIPVYNVVDYIDECVESILSQEYTDYEIILVNDGSTDGSGDICDRYSNEYNFITTHHQKNQGVSCARNQGIRLSTGEYILFVDSDDYISSGSLEKIIYVLDEVPTIDLVFLETTKVFPNGKSVSLNVNIEKTRIFKRSRAEVLNYLASLSKFSGSACDKLVNRSLIIENDIYFVPEMISEDIEWTLKLLGIARTFNYCEYDYYRYRQSRKNSTTNYISKVHVDCLIKIIKCWTTHKAAEDEDVFQNFINEAMAYEYMIVLKTSWKLGKDERTVVQHDLKELQWVIKQGNNLKARMTSMAISVLGIYRTSWLLNKYTRVYYMRYTHLDKR